MATRLLKTIKPSGGDYTSLEACMNANEQDLVTADQYFDVEISGEWTSADTTLVTIHNYTTDATRYINIYTTGDARHSGKWLTTGYRRYDSVNSQMINMVSHYVTIDGLQFQKHLLNYDGVMGNVYGCVIKNNIFYQSVSGGTAVRLRGQSTTRNYIYNNIIYGFSRGVEGAYYTNDNNTIYSNTVINCTTYGISYYSTTIYKNNICQSASGSDFLAYSGGGGTGSNNLSKDTTGNIQATLTFTDAANNDYSLASTDTDAINAGADLGSDYNTDIIGTARPQGSAWDIGAFEYISTATIKTISGIVWAKVKRIAGIAKNKIKKIILDVPTVIAQLQDNGTLTFFKDFTQTDIDAESAAGSDTATYTAARSASAPATYVDADGVVQLLTTENARRRQGGYYDATGFHAFPGEMIESAMTNYCLNSFFSLDANSDGLADSFSSDFGTKTLETCSINGITGGKSQKNAHTFTAEATRYHAALLTRTADDTFDSSSATLPFAISFWARGDFSGITTARASTSNNWLRVLADKNDNSFAANIISRTIENSSDDGLSATEWRRFTFTGTISHADARKVSVRFAYFSDANGSRPTTDENYWIEVYGINITAYPTSFIPTTTAALTRPAEVLKYAITGNRTAATESIFVRFMPNFTFANDGVARTLLDTDTKSRKLAKTTTGTKLTFYPNLTDSADCAPESTMTPLANTAYVAGLIAAGVDVDVNASVYFDGSSEATDADNYTSPAWGDYFYIGSDNAGENQINGVIQSVAIFSDVTDSTEISTINDILKSVFF
jgi:hypothetical protein